MNTKTTLPRGITQLPSGAYRAQIRKKGFKPFDTVSTDLEHVVAARQAELDRQEGVSTGGSNISLNTAAEQYFESVMFADKGQRTRYEEKLNLAPVLKVLGQHSLGYIANNLSVVTGYRDARQKTVGIRTKKRITGAKTRVEIAALSSIYRWAIDRQLFDKNPLQGLNRGKPSPMRKRRYNPGEITTLELLTQNGKEPWAKEVARFLLIQLEIGCRPGELAKVQQEDINLLKREMLFRDTKNGTSRNVHLTAVAIELVGAQLMHGIVENAEQLFFSRNQKTKNESKYNYRHGVDKLKKAGLLGADFIPYAGRKEFITRGFEQDVSMVAIQFQVGHKTLQSVERYKVDAKMTEATRAVFDDHSEKMQMAAAAEALATLPKHLRKLLIERQRDADVDTSAASAATPGGGRGASSDEG